MSYKPHYVADDLPAALSASTVQTDFNSAPVGAFDPPLEKSPRHEPWKSWTEPTVYPTAARVEEASLTRSSRRVWTGVAHPMLSAMPELNPKRRLPERHKNLEDCYADREERRSVLHGEFSELSELPGITEERFFPTPPSKPRPMKAPFQRPYVGDESFQGRMSYKPRYVAEDLPAVLTASTLQTERPATCAVVAAAGAVLNGCYVLDQVPPPQRAVRDADRCSRRQRFER